MYIYAGEFHYGEFIKNMELFGFDYNSCIQEIKCATKVFTVHDRPILKLIKSTLLKNKYSKITENLTDISGLVHLNSFLYMACSNFLNKNDFLGKYNSLQIMNDIFVSLPDEVMEEIKNKKTFYFVSKGGRVAERKAKEELEKVRGSLFECCSQNENIKLVTIPLTETNAYYLVY